MNTDKHRLGFGIAALVVAVVCAGPAQGQSLFEQPVRSSRPPAAAPGGGAVEDIPGGGEQEVPYAAAANESPPSLEEVGLAVVVPPEPRKYAKHDLVEVIVNESSLQSFEQSLDTNKKYDLMAELAQFPSIRHLLEAQFTNNPPSDFLPMQLGITSDGEFEGDGEFERKDKITARITATVVDVKPNGNLVLEARETISSDKEVSTMVLAGVCRGEDITNGNTIQSSQLAGLTLKVEHEGEVKKTSEKGLIPRVLEAIFNF